MTEATPPPPPPRRLGEEMDELLRDMTRDSVTAARRGWRIAARVGAIALQKAEEVTDHVAQELRSRQRPPAAPPPPPPPSQA